MNQIDPNSNFFGRKDILELLKRRVIDLKEGYRQNVALVGSQYIGKSSTLHNFLTNFDDDQVITIYLDLENKDFRYFFNKFTGSLLYNFCVKKKLPLHTDLNLLIECTAPYVPNTVDVIKKIQKDFQKGRFNECFLGLMVLPEVFTNETGKFCVLILDEFQNLEEFLIPDIFQDLGKKIMTQKRCLYILSSSYQSVAKKILSEKLSLLFGNFEVVNIEPFDFESSQKFIEHNFQEFKIGIQLRNFLTDFTGGHPLYLNLICQELINLCALHKQTEVYMPLLSQAVENSIFNRWGVISRHFELVINEICQGKGNRVMASILMSLANGQHKVDALCQHLDIKKGQLTLRLNRLIELGVVAKNGQFFCFKEKLFKYWVKYVYQKRVCDVELAPDKQRKEFKEEFNAGVEQFKATSRKDFSSRIVELLYCFDNEALDLNGRKYKLPQFRKITPSKLRNEQGIYVDVLRACTDESDWFIVMKKDIVGEIDVNAILSESKKCAQKPQRCLIITLNELDENAKLRALQERFWIWNEGELNTLLTLFDKPYITR